MTTSFINSEPQLRFVLLVAVVYYLPPALLWLRVIPFTLRFHVLVAMSLLMVAYAYASKFSLNELGFRKDTLKASLCWNGLLSATFVLIMLLGAGAGWIRRPIIPDWNLFFGFYVLVSSPSQEFLFRSIMFAKLNRSGITGWVWQIAISAVTYSFAHAFYGDAITLGATLLMGVVWGLIYRRYPNFWGVALSHALLGTVSILTGLI